MREEFKCPHCQVKLVKIYGEELPKPKRVVYSCPACWKELYGRRTAENAKIRLNER